MALQITANAFDNADGQLARLTKQGSLYGAVVDGFADYLVFLSIYLHLSLRYMAEGGASSVWLLAIAAGVSHAVQSMVIDYYRDGYLYFVVHKPRAEIDSSREARAAYERISWRTIRKEIGHEKLSQLRAAQEALMPKLRELRATFRGSVPEWLTRDYRQSCRPLLKWQRTLATNSRMFLLFLFLLLGRPLWFFWSELTLLNVVLIFLMLRHDAINGKLLSIRPHEMS